jgi:hypothetical protein
MSNLLIKSETIEVTEVTINGTAQGYAGALGFDRNTT